jgi:putative oxidoreductase
MRNRKADAAQLAGRVLLCAIFLWSGYGKVTNFAGTQEYMESQGMPFTAVLLALAIFAELAGGLSLLLGFFTRLGAAGLVLFMAPTTFIFHAFWAVPEEQMQLQLIMFMKNVSLTGGLLYVAALGAGAFSVDGMLARRSHGGAATAS